MLEAEDWPPLRGGEGEDLGPLDREPLALAVLVMV